MISMIWFPWITTNITKCLSTSSWRLTHHIITPFRSLYGFLTKWTYFRIYCYPFYICFIFCYFCYPLFNNITRCWWMKILLASKTKFCPTRTSNILRWCIVRFYYFFTIYPSAVSQISTALCKSSTKDFW